MNYIELINNFWRLNKEHSFTPNEKAVYFAILNKCNELGWKNPFNQSSEYLAMDSGMSVSAMQKARNILKQLELINFKAGDGRRNNTSYEILNPKGGIKNNLNDTLNDTLSGTLSDTLSCENGTNNTKLKTKLNKTKLNKEIDKELSSPPISFKDFSKQEFYDSLKPFVQEFGKETVEDFFYHWTELDEKGKMRYQLQKTWGFKARLRTFKKNEKAWGTNRAPKIDNEQAKILGPWAS